MNFFSQAQSLKNIIDCLCLLFANYESSSQQQKDLIDDIIDHFSNIAVYLQNTLVDNGFELNDSNIPTDPCELANYVLQLTNLVWIYNIPIEVENNPFTSILNDFGSLISQGENPCGEPFDANLKLNIPCSCRILGLVGKLEGEVDQEISHLYSVFEELKQLVIERSDGLIPPEFEWPESICDQVRILSNLLELISLDASLADEELMNKVDEFNYQVKIIKPLLAELGIYPCEHEIDLESDDIYIQAVGSDGSDGSVSGAHLRWSFMNELAEKHLPKGEYTNTGSEYATSIELNQPNDFIRVFKFPYNQDTRANITLDFDLLEFKNINVKYTSNSVIWSYDVKISGSDEIVLLTFKDVDEYNSAKNSSSGGTPKDLISHYFEIIEIGVENRDLFAIEFHFVNASSASNQYETLSEFTTQGVSDLIVSSRLTDSGSNPDSFVKRIVNEFIKSVKIKRSGPSDLTKIVLETYAAFYFKNMYLIEYINSYALTLDEPKAYKRLEDNSRYSINHSWPAFNNDVKVKTSNYQQKWSSNNGLKHAVQQYLTLSVTDPKAIDHLNSLELGDLSTFEISYLNALNIAAGDYHYARMLGLGEIDESLEGSEAFIYMVEYRKKDFVNEEPQQLPLLHFSLPTSKEDQRYPSTPILKPIEYGFSPLGDDSDSLIQIDDNGYAAFGETRFIRLQRDVLPYENPGTDFFENNNVFNTGITTEPFRYGIEYKGVNESSFLKPEITSNPDPNSTYRNYDADENVDIYENEPVVETDGALYVHAEKNEGAHEYGIYAINWFNRSSDISSLQETDETEFVTVPSLLPPSKVRALLLQSDLTELLATPFELSNFQNKIKVTFDWNHIHNINYPNANWVEFFHRAAAPLEIRGKIAAVNPVSGSDKEFDVTTIDYQVKSVYPPKTITPLISSANADAFVGGHIVINGKPYVIVSIPTVGSNPIIRVEGEELISKSFDSSQPNKVILSRSYTPPVSNSFFSAVENLSSDNNWNKLSQEIQIVHFGNPEEIETEEDDQGQTRVLTVGGITDGTTIREIDPSTKLYEIEFTNKSLDPHPEESTKNVYWFQGVARVILPEEKLELRVVEIVERNPLIIRVINNTTTNLPDIAEVNFHPSYLVYLSKEQGNNFGDPEIIPQGSEEEKVTFFSLRSKDDSEPGLLSDIAKPVELKTHRVYETLPPEDPVGPSFATRPDVFGKSTYTFDSKIKNSGSSGRVPYGMIFYRANEEMILNSLYCPSTVVQIKNDLKNLSNDLYHVNRFQDLANVVLEISGSSGTALDYKFKEYEIGGYRFPEPDSSDIDETFTSLSDKEQKLRKYVNKSFVPLTSDPVLYSRIKDGTITESKEPKIRNEKGSLLSSSNSEFYPYPMVRTFEDGGGDKIVRFTDYNLDGAANNEYFYYAIEIDANYRMGPRGKIAGPIKLVNSHPPSKPEINRVLLLSSNPEENLETRAYIKLNTDIIDNEYEKIRIYRTDSNFKAKNIALMDLVEEIDFTTELIDDFSSFNQIPFGNEVYYRVVVLKRILNENSAIELVASYPSDIVSLKIIDEVNPQAPDLSFSYDSLRGSIDNVILSWNKTVHNGIYYVFKMTESGTWKKIQELSTNDSSIQLDLANTVLGSNLLEKENSSGEVFYHRFKVDVENSSGLMNLKENIALI